MRRRSAQREKGSQRSQRGERGAALLIAMLIVTLIATLASAMVWQQWRAVQVEAAERARVQSAWILSGALDWARLILREDARSGGADHLGEPWATPLAEARLSSFLAADKGNTDDAPEAFLSGSITDAQSHYNLRNLVEAGQVVAVEQAALQRLFESIAVAPGVAARIATGLANALGASAPSAKTGTSASTDSADTGAPLLPQSVAQLTWLGVDEATVRLIAPYVVLLPVRTTVNINTAPAQVLAAVIDKLDAGGAERLVQARLRSPFDTLEKAQPLLGSGIVLDAQRVGVSSSYFELRGRLRLADKVLEERSLVERRGLEIIPLQRQRESLREVAG